jgi:transcription elongation factor GreA
MDESQIDSSKAYLGATVRVLNRKANREVTYTLVSPVEADMAAGKISVKSPVGQALVGKSVGDVAVAKAPAGDLDLEIIEITR